METGVEWLSFLLRWLHVMAGITWVGTSFYFNWFDASVRPPADPVLQPNIRGTLQEVHGGSFYYHEQYWPQAHPSRLLVHAWPAKTTFYSGLLLMLVIYWMGAAAYLVDSRIAALSAWQAVGLSVSSLVISWGYYSLVCRTVQRDQFVFLAMAAWVLCMAYVYTHVFGGRGAFISMGVMLGSLMGLNVIRNIVPNHIAMRQQLQAGQALDTQHGHIAKRHSQHNNYFTIPVVFCMLSNHFALAYNHACAWLILSLLLLAGWGVRHYLNVLYKYDTHARPVLALVVVSLLAAITLSLTPFGRTSTATANLPPVTTTAAMQIVQQHCLPCHASHPTQSGFASAPMGLVFEKPAQLHAQKSRILYQVITTHSMPLGNLTQMREEERVQLATWLNQSQ